MVLEMNLITVMVVTNLVLPIFIKDAGNFVFYSRLGVYSVLILVGFMSYSMARHGFLNIKVLAVKLFAAAIMIIFFVEIFSFREVGIESLLIIRVSKGTPRPAREHTECRSYYCR